MNKIVITCTLFFCILRRTAAAEPFCAGNKCHSQEGDETLATSPDCHCDMACSVYRDCCPDKFDYLPANHNLTCKRQALVVNFCSKDWTGPEFIEKLCKREKGFLKDPVGYLPVISLTTGVTYNNHYCAVCNKDSHDLIVWKIKISCPKPNPNFSLTKRQTFCYNSVTNRWGIEAEDKSTFLPCSLLPIIPKKYRSKVRGCKSNAIEMCIDSFRKDIIQVNCSSYSDPVYSKGLKYKNLNCALCNGVKMVDITCDDSASSRSTESMVLSDPNETILNLNINLTRGRDVNGRKVTCQGGEIFDPFAKQCRNIECGTRGFKPAFKI